MLVIWDHGDGWRAFDTVKIKAPKKILTSVLSKVSDEREINLDKARELGKNVPVNVSPEPISKPESLVIPENKVMQTAVFRAISVDDAHDGANYTTIKSKPDYRGFWGRESLTSWVSMLASWRWWKRLMLCET